jgi:hypothetical protein
MDMTTGNRLTGSGYLLFLGEVPEKFCTIEGDMVIFEGDHLDISRPMSMDRIEPRDSSGGICVAMATGNPERLTRNSSFALLHFEYESVALHRVELNGRARGYANATDRYSGAILTRTQEVHPGDELWSFLREEFRAKMG